MATPKAEPKTRIETVKNVDDRVKLIMQRIDEGSSNPVVLQTLAKIVTVRDGRGNWTIAEKDWGGELKAIWKWIRKNIRYTLDTYHRDMYQSAERTLDLKKGDCDDLVILSGAMLQAQGFPVKIEVIDTSGSWNHIYLTVGMPPTDPKKWISFDAAATEANKLGFEYPDNIVRRRRTYEGLSGVASDDGFTFSWWHMALIFFAIAFLSYRR
jgi:hypothetical protein